MKTITAEMLEEKKACADQVALFRRTFPRGCRLTLANVEKAQKVGLSVEWAVDRFATKSRKDAYLVAIKSHEDAYRAAIKSHKDAYDAAIKPHWDAYLVAIWSHEDAYYTAIKPHLDTYRAAIKSHKDAHNAAVAKEALKALLGEEL